MRRALGSPVLLPDDLFNGPVDVVIDRDEILVVGPLTAPDPRR